jgi:hypothetical protein
MVERPFETAVTIASRRDSLRGWITYCSRTNSADDPAPSLRGCGQIGGGQPDSTAGSYWGDPALVSEIEQAWDGLTLLEDQQRAARAVSYLEGLESTPPDTLKSAREKYRPRTQG